MKIWVDSGDALLRAIKARGLKKIDKGLLANAYITRGGEKVTFYVGDPRCETQDGAMWIS